MSHGNDDRICCWCGETFHISAKGLSWHQKRCNANPNPPPLPEPKPQPKWTCPSCGKTITEARKQRHRCPAPKLPAIRHGKFNAALELMNRNDRNQARAKAETTCPRCRCTPCQTLESCGRWLRANAQHAERLRREDAALGYRNTD